MCKSRPLVAAEQTRSRRLRQLQKQIDGSTDWRGDGRRKCTNPRIPCPYTHTSIAGCISPLVIALIVLSDGGPVRRLAAKRASTAASASPSLLCGAIILGDGEVLWCAGEGASARCCAEQRRRSPLFLCFAAWSPFSLSVRAVLSLHPSPLSPASAPCVFRAARVPPPLRPLLSSPLSSPDCASHRCSARRLPSRTMEHTTTTHTKQKQQQRREQTQHAESEAHTTAVADNTAARTNHTGAATPALTSASSLPPAASRRAQKRETKAAKRKVR